MLGTAHLCAGSLHVDIGMLKEAHLKFQTQHTGHGTVQIGFRYLAGTERFAQVGEGEGTEVGVYTGLQGHLTGFRPCGGHMVGVVDAVDAVQVAHHKTAEVPLVAQQVGQEVAVAGAGHTVQTVVAGHHAQRTGIDGFLEGGQKLLCQLAGTHKGGGAVLAALGGAVANEVLQWPACCRAV